MRYLEIVVPENRRRVVLDVLDAEDVEYVVSNEASASGDDVVVRFPLPSYAVEPVLDSLNEAGLEDARVVVINVETVISTEFDELLDRYSRGERGVNGPRDRCSGRKLTDLRPRFRSPSSWYC